MLPFGAHSNVRLFSWLTLLADVSGCAVKSYAYEGY